MDHMTCLTQLFLSNNNNNNNNNNDDGDDDIRMMLYVCMYTVCMLVGIVAPSGKHVPVDVTGSSQTSYTVTYTPTEIGNYILTTLL